MKSNGRWRRERETEDRRRWRRRCSQRKTFQTIDGAWVGSNKKKREGKEVKKLYFFFEMGVLSGRWRENVNWAGTVGRPTPLAFFFWPALIYFSLCLRARAGSPSFTFLFRLSLTTTNTSACSCAMQQNKRQMLSQRIPFLTGNSMAFPVIYRYQNNQ